ncbi:cytochrome c oxidase accessory protein CcoG [Halopseudomonas bauzanensis]|uniref:Cytochrome c oxidase accessory protein CcoG n=1 Tax=Halopseudomonas bauzanensis TaxID=653930 RepID=A0A4U0YQU7_9GAMM|nr:cytochrome c oxidase accessory protein CcoG [Halopseudomonas bauzanensis]TKA92646.1 cytochrome c oxidase accessory protein CcoG [Halopseudomonas bauzanensis]
MGERIPVEIIDATIARNTPAQLGGPIHTRSFEGYYRRLRLLGAGLLFLLFFGTAWLNWHQRQAVLWDLASRKFHIFGATFWPQDLILLSAILIIAAFGLFFITVVAGRIWCGYTCPQSVWTWVFMWAEKVTEGDRHQRVRLDAAPWSLSKLLRRGAKHAIWLGVSLATALTFVGYFTPIRELAVDLLTFELGAQAAFWLFFFTAATYINAGWLREKVCRDMCPYGRFQSAMFDRDTLVIAYDTERGEQRGPRRRDSTPAEQGLGDCIDCTLCVQVCPTGIDIRDGLQFECIACAACIDACDSVMDRMGYARGLISYTSERAQQGGTTHWLRPRLLGYGSMLALMIGLFVVALLDRPMMSLDVSRDRGNLFRESSTGQLENSYSLKVINKSQQPGRYQITLDAPQGLQLATPTSVQLAAEDIHDLPLSVVWTDEQSPAARQRIRFVLAAEDDNSAPVVAESTFLAPASY